MNTAALHNEKELLLRLGEGDEKALRQLILQYSPLLGPYVFEFTQSREQTQEIIQDTFLRIWQLRDSLVTVQNFRTFLYVIAKHYTLNALRATMREYKRREQWQDLQSDAPEPEDELLDLVNEAIDNLPAQLKQVWVLSRREDRSHAEIAESMSLSVTSVKKYMQRANAAIAAYVLKRSDVFLVGVLFTPELAKKIF